MVDWLDEELAGDWVSQTAERSVRGMVRCSALKSAGKTASHWVVWRETQSAKSTVAESE